MIVSRRHGLARPRGLAVCSGPVSIGAATEENETPVILHGVSSRGT